MNMALATKLGRKSVGCMCGETGLSLADVVNWQKGGTEADCLHCGPWVVFVARFDGGLGRCRDMLATTLGSCVSA